MIFITVIPSGDRVDGQSFAFSPFFLSIKFIRSLFSLCHYTLYHSHNFLTRKIRSNVSNSSRELRGFRRTIHSPVKCNHRKKVTTNRVTFFNQSKILPISIPVRVIYRCGRINSINTDASCNHAYRFERFIYRFTRR